MLLSVVGVEVPEILGAFSSLSGVMVEVEGDREKVLVRGPKWVSFNSVGRAVSNPRLNCSIADREARTEQEGGVELQDMVMVHPDVVSPAS